MIIHLPFPDAALFPNRSKGRHWTALASTRDAAHKAGYWATKQAAADYVAPDGHIPLSLLFLTPDKRHRDADNMLAAAKHLLDGMASALGVDDRRFKPLLVDWATGARPGALIAAVGVTIVSSQVIS